VRRVFDQADGTAQTHAQAPARAQGRVRCIGAPLELKARHCGGYTVHARVPCTAHPAFLGGLRDALPSATVTASGVATGDADGGAGASDALVATVAADGLDVARLFEAVHGLHAALGGGDGGAGGGGYAVAQASLEEVFLQVASDAEVASSAAR
jgi:hypothetical protein